MFHAKYSTLSPLRDSTENGLLVILIPTPSLGRAKGLGAFLAGGPIDRSGEVPSSAEC